MKRTSKNGSKPKAIRDHGHSGSNHDRFHGSSPDREEGENSSREITKEGREDQRGQRSLKTYQGGGVCIPSASLRDGNKRNPLKKRIRKNLPKNAKINTPKPKGIKPWVSGGLAAGRRGGGAIKSGKGKT